MATYIRVVIRNLHKNGVSAAREDQTPQLARTGR
jgi:hypothetical protein